MKIQLLTTKDRPALESLIQAIEGGLPHRSWWLPIYETAKAHFFDPSWTLFYGAFAGDHLIGASALFLNEFEFRETATHVNLPLSGTAEIGRCMVLPEWRGRNIMLELNRTLLKVAKEKDIQRVIATAHPDNMASCRSLEALGMNKTGEILKCGKYERNICMIEI